MLVENEASPNQRSGSSAKFTCSTAILLSFGGGSGSGGIGLGGGKGRVLSASFLPSIPSLSVDIIASVSVEEPDVIS